MFFSFSVHFLNEHAAENPENVEFMDLKEESQNIEYVTAF